MRIEGGCVIMSFLICTKIVSDKIIGIVNATSSQASQTITLQLTT